MMKIIYNGTCDNKPIDFERFFRKNKPINLSNIILRPHINKSYNKSDYINKNIDPKWLEDSRYISPEDKKKFDDLFFKSIEKLHNNTYYDIENYHIDNYSYQKENYEKNNYGMEKCQIDYKSDIDYSTDETDDEYILSDNEYEFSSK
jgi:hypothetical protein